MSEYMQIHGDRLCSECFCHVGTHACHMHLAQFTHVRSIYMASSLHVCRLVSVFSTFVHTCQYSGRRKVCHFHKYTHRGMSCEYDMLSTRAPCSIYALHFRHVCTHRDADAHTYPAVFLAHTCVGHTHPLPVIPPVGYLLLKMAVLERNLLPRSIIYPTCAHACA